jgi:hypothetical protein
MLADKRPGGSKGRAQSRRKLVVEHGSETTSSSGEADGVVHVGR